MCVVTPEPVENELDKALILTIVPAALSRSGLAVGKLVSFAIGTNPPTSETTVVILSLTA